MALTINSTLTTVLVAGAAGFIGTRLVERLIRAGHHVVALDNLRRGRLAHLKRWEGHPQLTWVEADAADAALPELAAGWRTPSPITEIWHLAANSDIPAGIENPQVDLHDTFLTTHQLLRVARNLGVKRFMFASSSAIYGDLGDTEITEDVGPLMPISNYGAMKLASEAQISAAVEAFLPQAFLFRFPNVVGVPATHGVLLDFVRKLQRDPSRLDVLGNGTQRKSYLHVAELLDAMLHIMQRSDARRNVFNIGPTDEGVNVRWIAEQVVARVSPNARVHYGTSDRGWVGDVPKFRYSVQRLAALGWQPRLDSAGAIRRAVDEIACQQGC